MHFVTFAKLKKELGFYAPKIVGIWQIWHTFTNKWHSRIQGTWVSLILRHNGLKNFAKVYIYSEKSTEIYQNFPLSFDVKSLKTKRKIAPNICGLHRKSGLKNMYSIENYIIKSKVWVNLRFLSRKLHAGSEISSSPKLPIVNSLQVGSR